MRKIEFEERIPVPKIWGRALQRCEEGFTRDGVAVFRISATQALFWDSPQEKQDPRGKRPDQTKVYSCGQRRGVGGVPIVSRGSIQPNLPNFEMARQQVGHCIWTQL